MAFLDCGYDDCANYGYEYDDDVDYDDDVIYASDSDPFDIHSPVTFVGPFPDDPRNFYHSDSDSDSDLDSDSDPPSLSDADRLAAPEFLDPRSVTVVPESDPDQFWSDLDSRTMDNYLERQVEEERAIWDGIESGDLENGDNETPDHLAENETQFPNFWDSLRLDDEDERTAANNDFDWQEVQARVFNGDGFSEISTEEDAGNGNGNGNGNGGVEQAMAVSGRTLDWEILLGNNNLMERNLDLEHDYEDPNSYLAVQDSFVAAAEFVTFFGQLVENDNPVMGNPPAAKAVLENLPVVTLAMEELEKDKVACAVCKDDIVVEEKVWKLPCCHYYHGDCIVPWLKLHNTCPVCRHELPTDDPDYEKRKSLRRSLRSSGSAAKFDL